jgi:hypothetical protein
MIALKRNVELNKEAIKKGRNMEAMELIWSVNPESDIPNSQTLQFDLILIADW